MISVLISTLNAQASLGGCLERFVSATVDGLVREVVIIDYGSTDQTLEIADAFGCVIVKAKTLTPAEGLAAGVAKANFSWLLFVPGDSILDPGWEREVDKLVSAIESGQRRQTAAVFRYALDDQTMQARVLEFAARASALAAGAAHAHQGLLISRALYRQIGGFAPGSRHPFIDLTRNLGRSRLTKLRTSSVALQSPPRTLDGALALGRYHADVWSYGFQRTWNNVRVRIRRLYHAA